MSQAFNYRHLYYFWVVAKEGGLSRAADRLGMAVQTVSTQVRNLEHDLGVSLLKPSGRGVVLTEVGQVVLAQAEQIFQLGERLPELVQDTAQRQQRRLAVGISDSVPKLVVRRLLQPIIQEPDLRLLCHEDAFDDLLAALALHRLDVVLTDRVAQPNANLKVYSHFLGASKVGWYASEAWHAAACEDFPRSLASVPVLLPTQHASERVQIEQWFEREGIVPRIVGEFQDSALMATFGSAGMGVFPAADWVQDKLEHRYEVQRVGTCHGVDQHFYAIGTEKKVMHPMVLRLLP